MLEGHYIHPGLLAFLTVIVIVTTIIITAVITIIVVVVMVAAIAECGTHKSWHCSKCFQSVTLLTSSRVYKVVSCHPHLNEEEVEAQRG